MTVWMTFWLCNFGNGNAMNEVNDNEAKKITPQQKNVTKLVNVLVIIIVIIIFLFTGTIIFRFGLPFIPWCSEIGKKKIRKFLHIRTNFPCFITQNENAL